MIQRLLKHVHALFFLLKDQLTPRQFLLVSSVIVGLSSAFAAIVLKSFAHSVYSFATSLNHRLHFEYLWLILPVIGIVLTVAIVKNVLGGQLEKGSWRIIYAITRQNSHLPRKQLFAQIITSSITVGFGGSAGLESPVTVTGAAFGSNYAKTYRFTSKERTLLLACGVAAGIAAAFNAPIAGVLFTMEVLLADMGITAFIPLMMAAASGTILSKILLPGSIVFNFKTLTEFQLTNVPFYMVLGAITGFIAVYHSRMFHRIEHWLEKLQFGVYQKAILGSVMLSILILLFPPLFGEGYASVKTLAGAHPLDLLDREGFPFVATPIVLLAFVGLVILIKSIAVGLTLGSGGNGGNFAPALFVGSYTGFAFSYGLNLTGIFATLPVTNFTMIGMAGVLSGLFHAPLTAIFLIAEITGGYELFIPLMIVSSISFAISKRFLVHSLDNEKLAAFGHVVRADKDKHILSSIPKRAVFEETVVVLTVYNTVKDLFEVIKDHPQPLYPIVDEEKFVGIIYNDSMTDLIHSYTTTPNETLDHFMEPIRYKCSPDDTFEQVMNQFESSNLYHLPVVEHGEIVGYYSKTRLLEVYRKKMMDGIVE